MFLFPSFQVLNLIPIYISIFWLCKRKKRIKRKVKGQRLLSTIILQLWKDDVRTATVSAADDEDGYEEEDGEEQQ